MATANPDEAEITCKNPNCPKDDLKWKTIVAHITKAKKCKIFYTTAEIDAIKENSQQLQRRKNAERERGNYDPSSRNAPDPVASRSGVTKGSNIEKIRTQCKICKRSFISLLTHLNQSENCKNQYGEEYHKLAQFFCNAFRIIYHTG